MVKVVLNREGVRALLKSPEMLAICEEHAANTLERCGDGYEMDTHTGRVRVNAMVYANTYQAKSDNAKNNTILKALGGSK